ncbi:hypothetical protein EVAR_54977_1 [Eumeta japonica]|uniref:Uncharacterized protein n=1 Tax=Eumeta variegata TaxID=151549 RepID=A0A4C1Z4J6_EUMVA|nr:hypothetical protein EVAR_54977_1 [Eumeta japonica]
MSGRVQYGAGGGSHVDFYVYVLAQREKALNACSQGPRALGAHPAPARGVPPIVISGATSGPKLNVKVVPCTFDLINSSQIDLFAPRPRNHMKPSVLDVVVASVTTAAGAGDSRVCLGLLFD